MKCFNLKSAYDIIVIAPGGSLMDKQVIAALEIADHEVRLLVGQFFNGRLNILKVERVSHFGIQGFTIINENHIVEAIKKAVENASRNLGVLVDRTLLLIPGVHVKRVSRQLHVPITGRISEDDIRRAYKKLTEDAFPEGTVLSNTLPTKFFLNGSSTRKLPVNEKTDSLTMEADNYYIKQSIVFPYVSAVEKSGLKVVDVIIDDIGYAKEASLFEASIDKPIIGITLGEKATRLALFHKGVMLSNDYIDSGFNTFSKKIENHFKVPSDVVARLLYSNVDVDASLNPDPIFMWSSKSKTYTLSQKDLMDLVGEDVKEFLLEIVDRCEPIHELGEPRYVFTGESSVISGITKFLEKERKIDASIYLPSTFGVKQSMLTSLVGAFYLYKDLEPYRNMSFSSIDNAEFERVVLQLDQISNKDDSITQRLRNMFFER